MLKKTALTFVKTAALAVVIVVGTAVVCDKIVNRHNSED